jgi:acyl CoA:acetate/3-ketoacid CoA transferase alpha subunit
LQLGGKTFLMRADFALIHAFVADHLDNLTYVLTAR